jgi:hypothetical protein
MRKDFTIFTKLKQLNLKLEIKVKAENSPFSKGRAALAARDLI